ncbi:hypothetical protein JST97_09790 [bacterium]|nr:hypothetical protein [bacterium]
MTGFLDRLRGPGRLHKQGEFTLDVEQAGNKLARFQFRDQRDFLYHMVAGLFRLGALGVNISVKNGLLQISVVDLVLPFNLLETLASALLDQSSPQRRLAAAAGSLLSHDLVRFDWVGTGKEQIYDYLTGSGKNWEAVRLEAIRLEGLPTSLLDQACGELEKRAAYCRLPLTLQNRPLGNPPQLGSLGPYAAYYACRTGQASQLELVVDEMVTPPKSMVTEIPWHGICYGDFGLDASLTQVVEDERYQSVLRAIPSTYSECLVRTLDDPPRELLGKLLSGPPPAWASPELWKRLLQAPLFKDQRDEKWSLARLSSREGPIYFSGNRAPQDLPEVILLETSTVMRSCLQSQLGSRCQMAGELLLRQLRRRLNQQEWARRKLQGLSLPQRNWLAQQSFEQGQANWRIGIPDDWAVAGGTVTILHQGREVVTRQLDHPEITFVIVAEVGESQINEIWDDLTDTAWKDLEPRWMHGVEEVLKAMSSERAPEGALRTYLVEHLSRSDRPQDSYFSKTLLFQDWNDRMYSLHSLLSLGPGQVLGVVEPKQEPVEDWVPLGVYVRDSGWELRLLKKIRSLKVLELRFLLKDLAKARGSCQERQELRPAFGQGIIHCFVKGVELEPVKVDSAISYEAWVCRDDLNFQIRQDNALMGLARFRVTPGPKAQKMAQELTQRAGQLPLPRDLDPTWYEFLRQANLRNLGWTDKPCWPTLRQGLVSLERLLEWPEIRWTSGSGDSEYPEQPLLINLDGIEQKTLQQLYGGQWKCEDDWFTENQRIRELLQQPEWKPSFAEVLHSCPNFWLRPSPEPGVVFWLYRGRLIEQESDFLPAGVAAAVECQDLEQRCREGLHEKAGQLILQWLSQPRPKAVFEIRNWRDWENLNPEIPAALQRQPWFRTNCGYLSWEELLQKPALYRVAELSSDLPAESVFVGESGNPSSLIDRLLAAHPNGHSLHQSGEFIALSKRLSRQRELLEEQSRLLQRLKHKICLPWGELALDPDGSKECWLVLEDRALPVGNLPNGLVGCLRTSEFKLRRQEQRTLADLSQGFRRQLYQELAPLLQARLGCGRLNRKELECYAEILLQETGQLGGMRWIPCADGSLTSLAHLKLETQEQGKLLYWPRTYAFCHGGERLTPILNSPLLLELVGRFCGKRPELLAPPLLYQDVHAPSLKGVGRFLSRWGQAVENRLRDGLIGLETRRALLFESLKQPLPTPPAPPQPSAPESRVQLKALRRQASQLLTGAARKEMLRLLEKAEVGRCQGLWELSETRLILSESALKPYFTGPEPPVAVTLSLLISLVSAVNTARVDFTDEMEEKFLANLTAEVVGSWATSGNAE